MDAELKNHVESIAKNLEVGFPDEVNEDGGEFGAFDYLQNALDIEYTVSGKGKYLGARILVAFGGPNIWVNTRTQTVEGFWWADRAQAVYRNDWLGLDDACRELWECR